VIGATVLWPLSLIVALMTTDEPSAGVSNVTDFSKMSFARRSAVTLVKSAESKVTVSTLACSCRITTRFETGPPYAGVCVSTEPVR
jgi:hypothetical protein